MKDGLFKYILSCIHRLVLLMSILFFCIFKINATDSTGEKGTLYGQVVSAQNNIGIQYVSVALFRAKTGELVGGIITNADGDFKLDGLLPGNYYLEISFVGYQNKRVEDVEIDAKNQHLNLGMLIIGEKAQELEEVEVVAEKAAFEFKLDRKVVNVSEHYTAISGSAVNVLENVPSVTVDIEGNVLLRGSAGFSVLIDGVPSLLEPSDALRQIPASTIQTIEIITNPSAKYNPDGTAGIINVITKKNSLQGLSGVFNAKSGTNNLGADFQLNLQGERWKGFLGADYSYADYKGDKNGYRKTFSVDTVFNVKHDGTIRSKWDNYNVRGGVEFKIDTLKLISVDLSYGGRKSHNYSDLKYSEYHNFDTNIYNYFSHDDGFQGNEGLSVNSLYLQKFDTDDHTLSAMVSYSNRETEEYNENVVKSHDNVIKKGRKNTEEGPMSRWQTKLDYTLPLGEQASLEAGYQSIFDKDLDATGFFEDINGTGIYVEDGLYKNSINYKQDIHALYFMFGNQLSKIKYQLGLRGEYSKRQVRFDELSSEIFLGDDMISSDRYDYFPSAHLSYSLPANQELMFSYSRRIERVRSYHFEPFYTWEDAFNVSRGNSKLLPEYIDSYELNFLKKMDDSYFSFETYYSITHDKIEWVRRIYRDNILERFPQNVGKDYYLGMDATYSFDLIKWWKIDLSGSLYNYKVKGHWGDYSFNEQRLTWYYRVNQTIKINPLIQLQGNWRYYSKRITSQGIYQPVYTFDIAVRKDFKNRKMTALMELRDVFSTNNRENTNDGIAFKDHYFQKIHTPVLTFVFTYRFNNYKPFKKSLAGDDGLGSEESMER